MTTPQPAPIHTWLASPMEPRVSAAIEKLRRADDVRHVAVMPDVHLSTEVCIGVALATQRLLYPAAVGGDIGCGMLAVAFDADADVLVDPARAGRLLHALGGAVPAMRRHRRRTILFPPDLTPSTLSHPSLSALAKSEGTLQLGTLGGGNHFVELQADESSRLWLMAHTGSRAMGQAIRARHLAGAFTTSTGLRAVDAATAAGQAYASDVAWARRYADANRRAIAAAVISVLAETPGIRADESTLITCDHNHVALEQHLGAPLYVHRKGAMPADENVPGLLPGSMGTQSFHVIGRGVSDALRSSAHGAGRALSREQARRAIPTRDLHRQMSGIWYDPRLAENLREESPRAYKDIRAVLRAQHELARVTRTLRPLLSYKAR